MASRGKFTLKEDRHGIDPDPATQEADADPSVDGLLAQLGTAFGLDTDAGWGAIDGTGKALQKQRMDSERRMKAEADVFRNTFSTPDGRKCLAIMTEMTIDADPYPSEAMLPMEAITALVIAHNAQVKFVRAIYQAIARAENREAETRKA